MPTPEPSREQRDPRAAPAPRRREAPPLRRVLDDVMQASGAVAERVVPLLEHACAVLGTQRATLWTFDSGSAKCIAVAPSSSHGLRRVVPAGDWGASFDAVRVRCCGGATEHPLREALDARGGELLEAPVLGGRGPIGALVLEPRRDASAFAATAAEFAATIADRIAVVFESAAGEAFAATLEQHRARLHEAQRMQSLGRLTAGVAHDFNNALTAILGGVQLITDALPSQSELQATAARTLDAVEFAADLARQLLDFARGDPADRREVGIDEVLERMSQLLRTLLGDRRRLALELDAADALVRAGPTRLAQVVLNLVTNARDALPDGGTVAIRSRVEGDFVAVSVADDGTGIPPDLLARIFDPLFTTKAAGHGSGLGLATVQHVVDELGGAVRVESEPGRGTLFEIRLPRVR